MEACAVGEHIPQAFLRVRRIEGDQTEYLIIRMENILITSVSTGGSGGEDCLTENVSLNFRRVEVECTEQGPALASPIKDRTGMASSPWWNTCW